MSILHRYILRLLVKNFFVGLGAFTFLFLLFDFFDRIDNVMGEDASLALTATYFLYKIPMMANLMLPVGLMLSTLFTYGILSKNSEITAMRASGAAVQWLARPLIAFGLVVSVFSLILGEFVVPITERRQRELYNIDIKKRDQRGEFTQTDFWWRDGDRFYSANIFDSRTRSLLKFSEIDIGSNWKVIRRVDADQVRWIDPVIGWTMQNVTTHRFDGTQTPPSYAPSLPLPISNQPSDFYEFRNEPETMSFFELRRFITQQAVNGVATGQYKADLYSKLASPFVIVITSLIVLPFALRPARTGSMAASSLAAIFIAFSYYAVDSFSVAMGRAEILPPLMAAWGANILMAGVALVLNLGAEAPH